MKVICKKQSGFSILAVILVIVAVVVAIGVWALSGSSNTSDNSSGNYNTVAMSIVQDGALIKSVYDQYVINGASRWSIVYSPGTASTDRYPNILDSVKGISPPSVSSKALREGFSFPEGTWLYTVGYENAPILQADSQAIVLFGLNEGTCKSINKNLHGLSEIPITGAGLATFAAGVTKENPNIPYFSGELDFYLYPNLKDWQSGCIKLSEDNTYVYFQAMTTSR